MSKDQEILEKFNKQFQYVSDKNQYDVIENWVILKNDNGTIYGDCEDYALGLLYNLSGRSYIKMFLNLLFFRASIWYAKTQAGNGHAVLRWKGQWVDNIHPYFRKEKIHKIYIPYLLPMIIGKFILSKILLLTRRN